MKGLAWTLLVMMSCHSLAGQSCTGNACADLRTSYEGEAPNGCHIVTNIGSRTLYFTWGAFSGYLRPQQTSSLENPFGGCIQYIVGNLTAVYGEPPVPAPKSACSGLAPGPAFKFLPPDLYAAADQGARAVLQSRYTNVVLDPGTEIDTTFQQQSVTADCCGARSPLKASQIPSGMYVQGEGTVYWAIFNPKLTKNQFSITIYCGPEGFPGAGCHVRACVWVKERPITK